jgi:hypothetical protein
MERNFKGVWIPKEIWLNKELTWMEKLFFVEIDSLDNEHGCFASNDYFASFFDLSKPRCSQIINSLINKEYIKAEYERNGKEIKKRVLNIFNRGIKYSKLGIKNTKEGYLENAKDNNTYINNTINKRKPGFEKPSVGMIEEYCKERGNSVDPTTFFDFYESKGWFVGKNKMKDWKAAVRTWEKRHCAKKEEKEPELLTASELRARGLL